MNGMLMNIPMKPDLLLSSQKIWKGYFTIYIGSYICFHETLWYLIYFFIPT